jgi:hypothetical protein
MVEVECQGNRDVPGVCACHFQLIPATNSNEAVMLRATSWDFGHLACVGSAKQVERQLDQNQQSVACAQRLETARLRSQLESLVVLGSAAEILLEGDQGCGEGWRLAQT